MSTKHSKAQYKNGAVVPIAETATATFSGSEPVLPLEARPVDYMFLLWFFNFWFSVMFTDLHNFTASVLGVEVKDLEHANMLWPPKVLTKIYFAWARTVDPLLYENPLFWQCIEWMNLLTLMPMSIIAFIGFLRGWNWIRMPAVITSSFTFYSLVICMGTTLFGSNRSNDTDMFIAIYSPFLIVPACVIWRLWEERPFAASGVALNPKRSNAKLWIDKVVLSLMAVTLTIYFVYVFIWFRRYTDYMDGLFGVYSDRRIVPGALAGSSSAPMRNEL